ncbi:MAG: prepilin-type N-terminal cleavage/methylation domain-containing protein [Gammaproteobacteria bacterium]|nr:prepilin-type N-terminal cleavage/methylation domain-containing protein [Gammaproteobacteria bacterium]
MIVKSRMPSGTGRACIQFGGFSLIELLAGIAVLGVLVAIAVPSYLEHIKKAEASEAARDIRAIELALQDYYLNNNDYPDSLAAIGMDMVDPWGNPYEYLPIEGRKKSGKRRKDHSLVPINSDFDLYSMGEDGKSAPPLTAAISKDDIVRGNNGIFVGLGSDY